MNLRFARAGAAGAVISIAALGASAAGAGATTTGPTGGPRPSGATGASGPRGSHFEQAKTELERQLSLRAMRLANLVSDVAGSKTLSVSHADLLNARLSTEQASIGALVTKVPNDSNYAELNIDRTAMLSDNRVFAVMSPQVFETIGGDAVLAEDTTLSGEQSTLLSEVNSLVGDPGYQNALNHYQSFVRRLAGVSTTVARVEQNVLSQTPGGYPGNTHVFTSANRAILDSTISLAYASYDASVIGLASGGYSGS